MYDVALSSPVALVAYIVLLLRVPQAGILFILWDHPEYLMYVSDSP